MAKADRNLSDLAVKGYRKNVDVSEKRTIIIPTHDLARLHWFLAMIMCPGAFLRMARDGSKVQSVIWVIGFIPTKRA